MMILIKMLSEIYYFPATEKVRRWSLGRAIAEDRIRGNSFPIGGRTDRPSVFNVLVVVVVPLDKVKYR